MPKRSFIDLTSSIPGDEPLLLQGLSLEDLEEEQPSKHRRKLQSATLTFSNTSQRTSNSDAALPTSSQTVVQAGSSAVASLTSSVGSQASPIDLLEDEEEGDLHAAIAATYPVYSSQSSLASQTSAIFEAIDLTETDAESPDSSVDKEHQYDALISTIPNIDLEVDAQLKSQVSIRNARSGIFKLAGVNCASGKAVELSDCSFVRIATVTEGNNGGLCITGKLFVRLNSFCEKVPKRRNELVWIGDICREVSAVDIVRNRRLIMTNKVYPEMSSRNHPDSYLDHHQNAKHGPVFCRIKRKADIKNRLGQESWQFLTDIEADAGIQYRTPQEVKRHLYRERITIAGGSHTEMCPVYSLDSGKTEFEQVGQKYTFGDAFCGAGGTSCGASMAGLKLNWAFDCDPAAVATYRLNFPSADCHQLPVHEFINEASTDYDRYRVDVLHISPPCQPFSPAHTVPSVQRDEMNQAALFSVDELIRRVKPRIVTVEETEGLVSRHGLWFAALIHIFIFQNYSVSWKIITCGDYGIPQPTRRRLILVAAGPGETLPEFPAPTHAQHPVGQLKMIPTIHDCIQGLWGHPNHDTSTQFQTPQQPFSADTYAYTLTCNSGVGNYHPSGLRNYTVRELACLQTFPRWFRFAGPQMTLHKRQIGNAVPPILAKTWMKTIIQHLKRSDGVLDAN